MVPDQYPWRVLSALPAWQLTQVPRLTRRDDEASPGNGSMRRGAELTSAWCRAAPVAVAWVRERPGGPVRVMTFPRRASGAVCQPSQQSRYA